MTPISQNEDPGAQRGAVTCLGSSQLQILAVYHHRARAPTAASPLKFLPRRRPPRTLRAGNRFWINYKVAAGARGRGWWRDPFPER